MYAVPFLAISRLDLLETLPESRCFLVVAFLFSIYSVLFIFPVFFISIIHIRLHSLCSSFHLFLSPCFPGFYFLLLYLQIVLSFKHLLSRIATSVDERNVKIRALRHGQFIQNPIHSHLPALPPLSSSLLLYSLLYPLCASAPSLHFHLPVSFHFLLLRVLLNLLLLICPRSSLFLRSCIVAPPRLSSSTLPWPTPLRFFSSFSRFNRLPFSEPSFSASLPCPLPLFARSYVCVCHYTVVIHASTYTEGKQSTRIRIHVGRLAIAFGYNMYSVYPTVDSWYLILESFCVREEWLIVG